MVRRNEHDCTCDHCKNHICSIMLTNKGIGCSDPKCENNLPKDYKGTYVKLISDNATIKEAFIFEELQSYMDLSDPANPKWITPVKLRLQEKKDWEENVKAAIEKLEDKDITGDHYGCIEATDLIAELGLND